MEFKNDKPIYVQIADNVCEKILNGEMAPGGRIDSIREFSAAIGVNPNTVARSYELLTQRGVIRNQRGIGYFITDDATATIKDIERKRFVEEELPVFIRRADLLGIDLKDFIK